MSNLRGHHDGLECRRLTGECGDILLRFLEDLRAAGDDKYFKPHEFSKEEAERLCHYEGEDLFYILVEGMRVLGYGMLRGWDQGYSVPSLGIAIHPDARRSGLGRAMMEFLHAAAARRGAAKVRLRVSPGNEKAIALYRSLGYEFSSEEEGLLVGVFDLRAGA